MKERLLPMLHVPVFATNDAHERFCRAVIERAGMVTHAQTKAGLERRALEAIQRLGFREAETLTVNGDFQRADSFRKSIRANMLHREKIRLWGPVRAREPSVVHTVSVDLSRFQQMTLPSTLSSGPYETAASVRARGAWQPPPEVATTVQVPENYGAAMDHTGAHYDRCLREIFSIMSLFSTQKNGGSLKAAIVCMACSLKSILGLWTRCWSYHYVAFFLTLGSRLSRCRIRLA